MANFEMELPKEVMNKLNDLSKNSEKMFMDMTKAGAEVVMSEVRARLNSSFKTTNSLTKGLKISRPYKTPSDDGINTKVMFSGYNEKHVPIPLIALAREYGTSRGEKKKPFLRPAFRNKSRIESAMKKIEERYLGNE